jgi:hypothetical protein
MTKGQEIVQQWKSWQDCTGLAQAIDAAIAEAVREARPARCQEHKYMVTSLNSICEICDMEEAVAEAVSQRTVECAEVAQQAYSQDGWKRSDIPAAILALNTPAPAYPFAQPCQCWVWRDSGNGQEYWLRGPVGSIGIEMNHDAAFCEKCGAKRKGS